VPVGARLARSIATAMPAPGPQNEVPRRRTSARAEVPRRWISARAVLIHLGTIATITVCLAAARWQIHRAASGNILSYAYAVEWPLFAVAAVVMWWQLLHSDSRPAPHRPDQVRTLAPPDIDDPDLRAYNHELAGLAARGRRKTWRNPRGLP